MLAPERYVANVVQPEEELSEAKRWEQAKKTMASNYLTVFESEIGKMVLDDLIKSYLTGSFANAGSTQIEVGIREGEARVVRKIIQLMEYAKGVERG